VLVADQPEKVAAADQPNLRIDAQVKQLIDGAQSEVLVTSPYFVPSKDDDAEFVGLARRGVHFQVLTHSLASTDEPAVHQAYAGHRRSLLAGGVQLFELKPEPEIKQSARELGASSGISLHAKSVVVDHRYVFVGSMNMDQRSKSLNTEMGLIVDSPALAEAVAKFFHSATDPANAYQVQLGSQGGGSRLAGMHWLSVENGQQVDHATEPAAPIGKRVESLLLRLLPIDSLL
jgi:putative cardiolipin synthase